MTHQLVHPLNLQNIQNIPTFFGPLKQFGTEGYERLRLVQNDHNEVALEVREKRGAMGRVWLWIQFKGKKDEKETLQTFQTLFAQCHTLCDNLSVESVSYLEDYTTIKETVKTLKEAIDRANKPKLSNKLDKDYRKLLQKLTDTAFNALPKTLPVYEESDEIKDERQQKQALKQQVIDRKKEIKELIKYHKGMKRKIKAGERIIENPENYYGPALQEAVDQLPNKFDRYHRDAEIEAYEEAEKIIEEAKQFVDNHPQPAPAIQGKPTPYSVLLTDKTLDVQIVCSDGKTYANSMVLSQISPVFKSLLNSQGESSKSNRPSIIHFNYPKTVVDAAWLYCQNSISPQITVGELPQVLAFATEYQLTDLQKECRCKLQQEIITIDAALYMLDQTQDEIMLNHCKKILLENFRSPKVQQYLLDQSYTRQELYEFLYTVSPVLINTQNHLPLAKFLVVWVRTKSQSKLQQSEIENAKPANQPQITTDTVKKDKGKEKLDKSDNLSDNSAMIEKIAEQPESFNDLFTSISDSIPNSLWDFVRLDAGELGTLIRDCNIPTSNTPKFEKIQWHQSFRSPQTWLQTPLMQGSIILESTPTKSHTTLTCKIDLCQIPTQTSTLISPPFYLMKYQATYYDTRVTQKLCCQAFLHWNNETQSYIFGIKKFGATLPDSLEIGLALNPAIIIGTPVKVNLKFDHPTNDLKDGQKNFDMNSDYLTLCYKNGWPLEDMKKAAPNGILGFTFSLQL